MTAEPQGNIQRLMEEPWTLDSAVWQRFRDRVYPNQNETRMSEKLEYILLGTQPSALREPLSDAPAAFGHRLVSQCDLAMVGLPLPALECSVEHAGRRVSRVNAAASSRSIRHE